MMGEEPRSATRKVVVNRPENKPQTFEATDYLIIDLQGSAWLQNHAKEESKI